jgi:hypothetical protein
VSTVNPAILGDEYLYSINARHAAPWDPSPAGDLSNYLFYLVYSSTNLCGDAFYSCGKILNLIFFIGFLIIIFIIAVRFLNYWVALAFTVAAGLSPISVYTSIVPARVDVFLHDQLGVLGCAESSGKLRLERLGPGWNPDWCSVSREATRLAIGNRNWYFLSRVGSDSGPA